MTNIFLIFFASLASASASSITCHVYEAQIIATVKVVKPETCTYGLDKISFLAENSLCPLLIEDAMTFQFSDKNCTLKAGDKISGILGQNSKGQWIWTP